MEKLNSDYDFSKDNFPHMSFKNINLYFSVNKDTYTFYIKIYICKLN